MKHQIRKQDTRDYILKVSRELYYEHGYNGTTSRMIAEKAEVNLGLLNYYFNGKKEIAAQIYFHVRSAFETLLLEDDPEITESDMFFISSALELYLCLECFPFGRFFDEIILFPEIHQRLMAFNTKRISSYGTRQDSSDYPQLAALSIVSIKPSLVDHALHSGTRLSTDVYLQYYLEQQLHYFGLDTALSQTYMDLLKQYYINVAANFTPVLTRLL